MKTGSRAGALVGCGAEPREEKNTVKSCYFDAIPAKLMCSRLEATLSTMANCTAVHMDSLLSKGPSQDVVVGVLI